MPKLIKDATHFGRWVAIFDTTYTAGKEHVILVDLVPSSLSILWISSRKGYSNSCWGTHIIFSLRLFTNFYFHQEAEYRIRNHIDERLCCVWEETENEIKEPLRFSLSFSRCIFISTTLCYCLQKVYSISENTGHKRF